MKTNEQMIADIIKRKEEYDAKRGERNRRVRITAAVLATVIIAAAIPATVFIAAAGKTPAPAAPPETETAVTQEAPGNETTAEDVTTGNGAATEKETTENHETTARETVPPETETEDEGHKAYSPGEPFQYGFTVDFYEKDKTDPLVLTKKDYGRQKWLNKNTVRQYEIDLPAGDDLPDDHDYSLYSDSFYGYKKQSDVYELEIKLKNINDWAGDEYLLRIEGPDGVEILSEDTIKSVFPTVKDETWNAYDPGDYVSIPLKFRFTNGLKWADIRIYIFTRTDGNEHRGAYDYITEAEEYFASGKSMKDKAFPGWKETFGKFNPLLYAAANYYTARFMEIKDYVFLLDSPVLQGTTELYERAALYFGDVDDNGVPIFITQRDHPDYINPCKIPMLADTPGYNDKYKSESNRRDVLSASRGSLPEGAVGKAD